MVKNNPNEIMVPNKNKTNSSFDSTKDLLKVLDYLPHSNIINLKCVSKEFNDTIKGILFFIIFYIIIIIIYFTCFIV